MKISEMIQKLTRIKEYHGDLETCSEDGEGNLYVISCVEVVENIQAQKTFRSESITYEEIVQIN